MKTKRQYILNSLLLTAVALLMRTVSVSFNVYVSNRVGAEVMGLLALVSSVYGFAVTLATSGIQLATVRTLAERLEQTGGADTKRCLRACLAYAAFFGTLATILLCALSAPIGIYALKEIRTVRALRMLSFTLLPISLCSVMNGYFTAVRRAWKNALVQVTEQAVKITLTGYLLVIVAPRTVEGSMLAILLGGAVSESISLLFNVLLYLFDKHRRLCTNSQKYGTRIQVAKIALPVAVSAYMRSGLLAIEHALIPRGLKKFGAGSAAALAAYGALHSMALPVVLYPAALLSSFASLLIPEVTEQQSANNRTEITYIAGRVYQMTLLFAIGTAGVMLCLSGELGEVLYHSSEVARFIGALAPIVPIMYLDTATDAMLKGLGQQVYSMNINILDASISVVAVALLVPRLGINGYLVTIYITELFNASLSISRLLKITGFRPSLFSLVGRPLLAVVGATSILRILFTLLPMGITNTPQGLVLHILVAVFLYLALLFLTGGFDRTDRKWLIDILFPSKPNVKKRQFTHAYITNKKEEEYQ